MRAALYSLILTAITLLPARADLTIVYSTSVEPAKQPQKPQETASAVAAATNMTIKVKGDKARIDAPPQMTAIFDGSTGELINLLNDQKTVVRISSDKMRAIGEMLNKPSNNKTGPPPKRLTPTGQKEMIDGYETEEYTYEGPDFRATYWIAPNYPNGAAVLAQLQSIKSELWDAANTKMPDFRDFAGLPIRMRVIVGKQNQAATRNAAASDHPTEIMSKVTAVSLDSIPDSEFRVPATFTEGKLPNVFKGLSPTVSPIP